MTLFWIFIFIFVGDITTSSASNRIVGGSPTAVESYPAIVQVEFLSQINGVWTQNCGGTILTARFVLSAAKCFSGWNSFPSFRRIRAGATYRHSGGIINYIINAVNHPGFNPSSAENDISVVRLREALPSLPTIQRATIVAQGQIVPDNVAVVLTGWGQMFSGGPHSQVLQEVTVNTINNEICARRYAVSSIAINVTDNMICAGILDVGGKGVCYDDAGGPMYFRGIVVGVISSYDCANSHWPGVSTAVASYTNWIIATAV